MKTFHNTLNETGDELFYSRAKARSQQERILAFFREHPDEHFTPFEIHEYVLPNAPITSVRRGMTNLQKAGYLAKTDMQVLGYLGKNNHCWRLKDDKKGQMPLF